MAKRMKLMEKTTDDIEAAKIGWGDLDCDLLHQILLLLPVEDLVRSMPFVCRHWKLACGTVLFWKDYETLDLRPLKILLSYSSAIKNHDLRIHRALKFVLNWETREHHLRCIRTIIFSPSMHLNDIHLAFLEKRSPRLKKLVLPKPNDKISLRDFSMITQTWTELEELSIGSLEQDYSNQFLPTLDRNRNLTTVNLYGFPIVYSSGTFLGLDERKASIIANNLPKLRVLTLDEVHLRRSGVWTLLSKSKNLAELNLKRCNGETIREGSKLIFLNKKISAEIRSCRLKNCLKWYIASSSSDHKISPDQIMYTAEELVNQLWTGDVVVVDTFV